MEQDGKPTRGSESGEDDQQDGFLNRILSIFFGMGDPEREKRRILKVLGKNLAKDRRKLYSPKGPEVLPAMGRLI